MKEKKDIVENWLPAHRQTACECANHVDESVASWSNGLASAQRFAGVRGSQFSTDVLFLFHCPGLIWSAQLTARSNREAEAFSVNVVSGDPVSTISGERRTRRPRQRWKLHGPIAQNDVLATLRRWSAAPNRLYSRIERGVGADCIKYT